MLTQVHPKLPMRDKSVTRDFFVGQLGFEELGDPSFEPYLMVRKDNVEIHFFLYKELMPDENYGQIYIRTDNIASLYTNFRETGVAIHPNGPLQTKPWGQIEFALLDPDNNLLTFGEAIP